MEINLILVCGQGSIGKSTYIKNIINNFYKYTTQVVAMDNIITFDNEWENRMKIFIQQTQDAINQKKQFIFCDLAFDSRESRKQFLSSLNIPKDILINLIIIELRPGIFQLLKQDYQRNNIPKTKSHKDQVVNIYASFQFANLIEFNYFNYHKLSIYIIDNCLNDFLTLDNCEYKELFLKF